jgi:hypothetical protein
MTIQSKRLWMDKEGTDEVSEYHATIGNRGICYCFVGNRGTCYCFIVSRCYESPGDLLCEASRKTLDAKLRTDTVRLQHLRFDGWL